MSTRTDDELVERIASYGHMSAELLEMFRPMLLPPLRNDYKALEAMDADGGARWTPPEPRLPESVAVHVLGGETDKSSPPEQMDLWIEQYASKEGVSEARYWKGGHFYYADGTDEGAKQDMATYIVENLEAAIKRKLGFTSPGA